ILQTGSSMFDATTFEVWGALLNGGQSVLIPPQVIMEADTLGSVLSRFEINTLWLTSQLFNQLVHQDSKIFSTLEYLLVGGDVVSSTSVQAVQQNNHPADNPLRIINGYGPTENTTFSATWLFPNPLEGPVSIGKPINNSTILILNKYGYLQPIGIAGELYAGGDGVARGYLNRPDLTAKKFDHDFKDWKDGQDLKKENKEPSALSASSAVRLYKTGDMGCWLPEGNIRFLGRADHQVKIRGYRIELGEIRNRLSKHPAVSQAEVLARTDQKKEKYLCAYIVPVQGGIVPVTGEMGSGEEIGITGLREFLTGDLPDYMIPSFFVMMENIPLTPNGKIDRGALPIPGVKANDDYIAPGTPLQIQLVELWSEVLEIKPSVIGIDNGFFELGGHSLNATILVSRIHKALNVKVPLTEVFRLPTIRELARYIHGASRDRHADIEPVEKQEYYALSSAQKRLYIIHRMDMENTAYNMPQSISIDQTFSVEKLQETFIKLIHRHESLRTSFHMIDNQPVQIVHDEVEFEIKGFGTGNLRNKSTGYVRHASADVRAASGYVPDTSADVRAASKDVRHASADVRAVSGYVPDTSADVRAASGSVRHASADVRAVSGYVPDTSAGVRAASGNVRHASADLRAASGNVPDTSADVRAASGNVRDTSPAVHPTSGNVRHTSHTIASFIRPFELSRAPLMRVGLERSPENQYALLVDMHHIISDGVSLRVLVRDFAALYAGESLPPLRLQYKDFSQWQSSRAQSPVVKAQKEWWLNQMAGEMPVLEIPIDFPRPAVKTPEGSRLGFEIGPGVSAQLKQLANETAATPFMVLLALFNLLLSKLGGQEDIIIGTPTAGRPHNDVQDIIGVFINTLALRNFPSGDKPFSQFLIEVKENCLQAFENQDYQFEDLVDTVVTERDLSRNPLFDVMFTLQNMDSRELKTPGLPLFSYPYETVTSKFDLTLTAIEDTGRFLFSLNYSSTLFKQQTIERFINYFKRLTDSMIEGRQQPLSQVELLSVAEKQQILYDFNDTGADYPRNRTVHQLFEEQVRKTPEHTAVIRKVNDPSGESIVSSSYAELNRQADYLAALLMEKGIGSGSIAGLMLDRSLEMVTGIFAVLKTGAAYLPLDPEAPGERTGFMLADSNASILLTTNDLPEDIRFEGDSIIITGSINSTGITSPTGKQEVQSTESPAYVIYTSGSTGKPKGVIVEHISIVNTLTALHHSYPFLEGSVYLLKTSFVFDVSMTELFGWFWGGGRLAVLESGGQKDPIAILAAIKAFNVTHINFVPSMFYVFLETLTDQTGSRLAGLKYIFLAGEALLPGLVEKFRTFNTDIILENIYGPTEASVYASRYSLSRWSGGHNSRIPIGKPLPNTRLYILDKTDRLQPIGVPGELCISGTGVARGYLNRPELTAEKFVEMGREACRITQQEASVFTRRVTGDPRGASPWPSESRRRHQHAAGPDWKNVLYRSGDLARWREDGNIEFLGRLDHQVKVRGFRIELGEIENRLLAYEGLKEAVVISRGDGKGMNALYAYIVPVESDVGPGSETGAGRVNIEQLRNYLAQHLTDYMIPSAFIELNELPLTSSGKIDRNALPEDVLEPDAQHALPRDQREKAMVAIWVEVLNLDITQVGIHSNFFRLGGHSLKAVQLIGKIHKSFGIQIPLSVVFQQPTPAALCEAISSRPSTPLPEILPHPRKPYYELSYSQNRLWFINQKNPSDSSFNMPVIVTLNEVIDPQFTKDIFLQLAARHESLRTCFKEVDKIPMQYILPVDQLDVKIAVMDISPMPGESRNRERRRLLMAESQVVFDLAVPPLFRIKLVKCSADQFDLIFNAHHIITDGWSMEVLTNEFRAIYAGLKSGDPYIPEPLTIQYKDFAAWQNNLLLDPEMISGAKSFWMQQLSGTLPALTLPYDSPPTPSGSRESAAYTFVIPDALAERMHQLTEESQSSLFMLLFAGFNLLLYRMTGQRDIVMAIPAATRRQEKLDKIVGMFVNTLILRTRVNDSETFYDFFKRSCATIFQVLEYQHYPMELICSELKIKYPEIPVFFNMINLGDSPEQDLKNIDSFHTGQVQDSKFNMVCYISEYRNGISVSCHYRKELFMPRSIEKIMGLYQKMLKNILDDPQKKVGDYNLTGKRKTFKRAGEHHKVGAMNHR
ncbi:MAG: amino acid adenylation domain-containing protein, partial [bacterium]|nr:amino acid adenylation domain-containing protein [bacterium]